jgi:3-phenylpropionate/cinnamic acid dioxygenase small subunit
MGHATMLDDSATRDEHERPSALSDRARIHELTVRYALGVDRRDFDEVRACFAGDARVDYGEHYRGDVPGFIAFLRSGLARFSTTMHLLGNQLIELDGDTARVETYCVAYHRPTAAGGENDLLVVGVRYLDATARTDGAWRIARRTVAYDWRRLDREVLTPARS